jgi:N-acetylmuramoyl-L-alanine amidase
MIRLRPRCRFGFIPICVLPVLIALATPVHASDHLNTLGSPPRWDILEHYQRTITRDAFANLLQNVYCTQGIPPNMINVGENSADILKNRESNAFFTLRFAPDQQSAKRVPRLWRTPAELEQRTEIKPLLGLKVALDPGHIGGEWAKMEERWFKIGASRPVQEGNLTLRVARILADQLRQLGAKVSFVRNTLEPVTPKRPGDFRELAKQVLIRNGVPEPRTTSTDQNDPEKEHTIRWQSEMLFYRYSEIRRRAVLVNARLHPDLVVCLHFNAEGWGDPSNPIMIPANHLHLLVNGSYLQSELEFDDERFEMIRRLLSRVYNEELPLADVMAGAMAKQTGLPAFQYPTTRTTTKIGTSGYVYARNLLATRLYRCPVVYCEPYVMNNQEVFDRIQAGDYDGARDIDGVKRKSIFREYAESVADGLEQYYRDARRRPSSGQ